MSTPMFDCFKKILYNFLIIYIRGECCPDKLRKSGMNIGSNLIIQKGVIIDPNYFMHIVIGDNVEIGAGAHIYAHDGSVEGHLNYTKIGLTRIGNNVFIGAGTIVLAGVSIGNDSIIGAGSVVSKDIPSDVVAAGNPAKVICSLSKFIERHNDNIKLSACFDGRYSLRSNVCNKNREEMNKIMMKTDNKIAYVYLPAKKT